jgi:hypothetical protein
VKPENPYQAPASVVEEGAYSAPRRWGVMLLSLVALQILLAAIYLPTAFSRLQRGEIGLPVFSGVVLSCFLLSIGGFTFMRSARVAACCFFASAMSGAIAYSQWRPTFVFTGVMIAICAGLVSVVAMRRLAKLR